MYNSRISRKFERMFPNAKQPHDYSKSPSIPPMVDLTTILPVSKILCLDQPFPLHLILQHLVNATEKLLHDKNYDGPDYEEMEHSVKRAKEIIALFNPDNVIE